MKYPMAAISLFAAFVASSQNAEAKLSPPDQKIQLDRIPTPAQLACMNPYVPVRQKDQHMDKTYLSNGYDVTVRDTNLPDFTSTTGEYITIEYSTYPCASFF